MATNRIRAAAQPARPRAGDRAPRTDALERLYAYWLVSSTLFLVLIVTVSILLATRTGRQADQLDLLQKQNQELQVQLSGIENQLSGLKAAVAATRTPPPTPIPPPASTPQQPAQSPSSAPAAPAPTASAPAARLTEAQLNTELDQLLGRNAAGRRPPSDAVAAMKLLAAALDVHDDTWSSATWFRLTGLAAWLEDSSIDLLAARVSDHGAARSLVAEIQCRKALASRQYPQALALAQQLIDKFGSTDPRRLLLARCATAVGDIPASAELNRFLDEFGDPDNLPVADALALGGLLADQQRWSELGALLDKMPPAASPDDALEAEILRMAAAIQSGHAAEVRDRLDAMLQRSPHDDRIRLWLGVAQYQLRDYDGARVTLQFVEDHSTAPADWYWRAMVEVNAGNPSSAAKYLQSSLSFGGGYSPAWEALGTLAINRGDWMEAQTDISNAISANPGRAGAHFLAALIHAVAGRREEAAKSLSVALLLDHDLVAAARRVEAFKRYFDDRELQRLATTQPAE